MTTFPWPWAVPGTGEGRLAWPGRTPGDRGSTGLAGSQQDVKREDRCSQTQRRKHRANRPHPFVRKPSSETRRGPGLLRGGTGRGHPGRKALLWVQMTGHSDAILHGAFALSPVAVGPVVITYAFWFSSKTAVWTRSSGPVQRALCPVLTSRGLRIRTQGVPLGGQPRLHLKGLRSCPLTAPCDFQL